MQATPTSPMSCVLRWVIVLACLLPAVGAAHNTRLSSSRLTVDGAGIAGTLEVNAQDLEVALGIRFAEGGDPVARSRVGAERAKVFSYLLDKAYPQLGAGQPCAGKGETLDVKGDHLVATIHWRCPAVPGELNFVATLFHEIDAAARHMVTASGDSRVFALLSTSNTKVALGSLQPGLSEVLQRYFAAGVEHIAIGYDHIAFLIAVIVWGRRPGPLVAVVTAFTLAHSVTLSLAVLDVVRLPEKLVEILIALSIVYVAVENFFVRDIGRRWKITFLFGLIHGFGFASVLREYGIPQDRIGWALAAFNVGVEVGQLLIVGAALLLLITLDRTLRRRLPGSFMLAPDTRLPQGVSAVILALGSYWAVERLVA